MIKKEHILESARKVLTEQGINKLSLRKIAAETGCAAPSIYYYFKNKQEIVAGLWEEIAPSLDSSMRNAMDKDSAYREFWRQRPDDFRLFVTNAEYFPFVAKTPAYHSLKSALGDYFQSINMDCVWEAVDGATDGRLITCLPMICPFKPTEKQAYLETPCRRERAQLFMRMLKISARPCPGTGKSKLQH